VCFQNQKKSLNDRVSQIHAVTGWDKDEIIRIIKSLIKYEFLMEKHPINLGDPRHWIANEKVWRTCYPSKPTPGKILLFDSLLRFSKYPDEHTLHAKQGFVFEELCQSMIKHYKNYFNSFFSLSDKATIKTGIWEEPCTEIDIIVSDDRTKTVIWCSCKRTSHYQDHYNLMAHVVSFFNNRGYNHHSWYKYSHILLFLSPTFSTDQRKNLEECVQSVNECLLGDRGKLIDLIKNKLSNFGQRNHKPFEMSEGAPISLFQFIRAAALDIENFVANK